MLPNLSTFVLVRKDNQMQVNFHLVFPDPDTPNKTTFLSRDHNNKEWVPPLGSTVSFDEKDISSLRFRVKDIETMYTYLDDVTEIIFVELEFKSDISEEEQKLLYKKLLDDNSSWWG